MKTEDLSQMGEATVSLKEIECEQCIVKAGASAIEINFYRFIAPQLQGLNTPKLLGVAGDKLTLEFIPNKVDVFSLQQYDDVYKQLASLHTANVNPQFELHHHHWSIKHLEDALTHLNFPKTIEDRFRQIQLQSQELFRANTLISGDSNPGNWAARSNGELVLFDWERFGYGSPAIDLATLIPNLGNFADYQSAVEKYLKYNHSLSAEALLRQMVLAKCWIVIVVTNLLIERQKKDIQKHLTWYQNNVPLWLETMEVVL